MNNLNIYFRDQNFPVNPQPFVQAAQVPTIVLQTTVKFLSAPVDLLYTSGILSRIRLTSAVSSKVNVLKLGSSPQRL
jgi:hypothetical protein